MQSLLLFSAKLRDCNMPGFPILTISQSLLKCMSVELVMLSRAWWLILCHPLLLLPSIFPSIKSSPVSQLFASGGQSIGVSASASVFSMNIQGWFPLGLTGLIILQSRRLSRVFFSTTIWKHHIWTLLSCMYMSVYGCVCWFRCVCIVMFFFDLGNFVYFST